ncbi:DNA mismatch repair endonuclease MutL [Carboxydothermus pertinax]|uniref:DNA mismatch repair protein MutL n=1 Tax=Carboxydothermus pertinax TaxID=870242 RepID=A0A1L8CXQ3_9THEO|nr:DNA mismatch repair endonuclease MutL [Carboxydothermus pertinax]GAV23639.1 DNA mismatch repair protein MutL [Carboxydothermus pertinax]
MREIKILPEEVVKKIAAGEVVERPYSVVKELLENSIDAQAKNINVYIEEGGLKTIVVEDDGVGISRNELPKTILRHATSKIETFDDLFHLNSFGFRGEALYSIAAVSKLSIKSKIRGENSGQELLAHAGKIVALTEVGMPDGTIITVTDLFFNTPPRKKFLKSVQTEAGLIKQLLEKMAVLYPEIKFTLVIDGKKVFSSAGINDRLGLMAKFWGIEKNNVVNIEEDLGEGYQVKGGVVLPPIGKSHRKQQVFAVNKRLVKSGILTKAVDDAYDGLLPKGLKPLCFIEVNIPGNFVDVNVHPQKLEVKFLDEQKIYLGLRTVIRNRLVNINSKATQEQEVQNINIGYETNTKNYTQPVIGFAEKVVSFSSNLIKSASLQKEPKASLNENNTFFQVIGQFALRYIIVEKNETLLFIDQHAAHERILYEKYQTKLNPFYSQVLAFPVRLNPTPEIAAFIEENYQNLREIGLNIEPFGPGEFIVREVPGDLPQENLGGVLEEYLLEILEQKEQITFREKATKLLACKNAIKFGERLTYSEMTRLVEELFNVNYPYSCPHGRPTIFELPISELNKKFFR